MQSGREGTRLCSCDVRMRTRKIVPRNDRRMVEKRLMLSVMRAGSLAWGLLSFVCTASLTSPAFASGFAVARFGGEQGHPTATNPTAVYYNPAGIGMSRGTHLLADLNLVWRTQSFS